MIKADTAVFEELTEKLKQLSFRTDELRNILRGSGAEMADDAEFLLYPQAAFVCERAASALSVLDRIQRIYDALGDVISDLPVRLEAIENKSKNKISDITVTLAQVRETSQSVMSGSGYVMIDPLGKTRKPDGIKQEDPVQVADVSLTASVVQNQLKITGVEDVEAL